MYTGNTNIDIMKRAPEWLEIKHSKTTWICIDQKYKYETFKL